MSTIASRKLDTFGGYLQTVQAASVGDHDARELLASSGLNSTIDSEGGFLIPPDFTAGVIEKMYHTGEILSRCTRLPDPAGNEVYSPCVNESSRNDGSRFGAMSAAWTEEGALITGAKPKLGLQKRRLRKLPGLIYVTNELLQDAPALGAFVESVAARELAYRYEAAIVNGTGAGQPLGLLNASCKLTVSKQTNQTAATVWGQNVIDMVARLWGPSWKSAVWLYNQALLPQLCALTVEGRYGSGSTSVSQFEGRLWNWDGSPSSRGWPTLCGRPAIAVEYASAPGTEGDLILVDLSQYATADKSTIAVSADLRFVYDESAFKVTLRADGFPTWATALTPDNGTDALSPIVLLETRA